MKKFLTIIAANIICVIILYLIIAFITWDFNVKHWDEMGRMSFVFICVFLGIFISVVIGENT